MPSGKRQSIGRYHHCPGRGDEPRRRKLPPAAMRIQPVVVVHQLEVKGTRDHGYGTEIEPHLKIVRPQGLSSSSNTRPRPAAHAPGDSRLADSRPWPPARSHRAPPWPDRTTVLAIGQHIRAHPAGSICCLELHERARLACGCLCCARQAAYSASLTDPACAAPRPRPATLPRIRNSLARLKSAEVMPRVPARSG